MSPNLISLFHSDLFHVLWDVCFYLSLVGLLVMSSRHLSDMSDRETCSLFFFRDFFSLDNTMYDETNSCGDYCQVWCVAFFSNPSILVVTFGPHQ